MGFVQTGVVGTVLGPVSKVAAGVAKAEEIFTTSTKPQFDFLSPQGAF